MKRWQCSVCGFIYDETQGLPEAGIAPGTRWADIPDIWVCPDCGAPKSDFAMVEIDLAAGVDRRPIVIVGTGLGGYSVAREFRKLDAETPVLILTADDGRYFSEAHPVERLHQRQDPGHDRLGRCRRHGVAAQGHGPDRYAGHGD